MSSRHVLARQMRRAGSADRSVIARRLAASRRWRQPGLDPCNVDLEVFQAELQLIVIEPLGPPAELAALQLLARSAAAARSRPAPRRALSSRSAASERTSRCNVSTSSGRAADRCPCARVYADSRDVSPIIRSIRRVNAAAAISPRQPGATAVPARASRRPRSAATAAPKSAIASRRRRRSAATGRRRAQAAW